VADLYPGGVAGGDFLIDLCDHRPDRQAAFQQAKADHDFEVQELELTTNTELTHQIRLLTKEFHRRIIGAPSERHDSVQEPPSSCTGIGRW
jgi:hypothetical protein